MNTQDITVTLNVEEHEFLMDIITMTQDMFYLASTNDARKNKMLENIKDQLVNTWVDRFAGKDGINTPFMDS